MKFTSKLANLEGQKKSHNYQFIIKINKTVYVL